MFASVSHSTVPHNKEHFLAFYYAHFKSRFLPAHNNSQKSAMHYASGSSLYVAISIIDSTESEFFMTRIQNQKNQRIINLLITKSIMQAPENSLRNPPPNSPNSPPSPPIPQISPNPPPKIRLPKARLTKIKKILKKCLLFSSRYVKILKYGSLVKRLRRCPLTAESAVRFRYELCKEKPVNIEFAGFFMSKNVVQMWYEFSGRGLAPFLSLFF